MRFIWIIYFLGFSVNLFAQTRVCASCEFSSIREAVRSALPHDTLLVLEGEYFESDIVVEKPLYIKGTPGAVVDGEMKGYIFRLLADSITLEGIHMRNIGFSHTRDYAAVLINRADHFQLLYNHVEKAYFGFLIEKSDHGLIRGNIITGRGTHEFDSGNGVHAWHCSELRIEKNDLTQLRDGIYLEFVDDSQVLNNRSYGNVRYGLHFMFSNHDEYKDNWFSSNGAGVAVMFSKYIGMSGNTFYNNWGTASYGLLLKEIYDAEIRDNRFEENTIAINVDGSTRINYSDNEFISNGWAIRVTGGCYANVFRSNNFISNSFDISYNSKMNDNLFEGNYWSGYNGYDINRDGIGDVPYRPVKLFSYIVNKTPETIVLLRSMFIELINFSEKVSPVFTPDELKDEHPVMKRITW